MRAVCSAEEAGAGTASRVKDAAAAAAHLAICLLGGVALRLGLVSRMELIVLICRPPFYAIVYRMTGGKNTAVFFKITRLKRTSSSLALAFFF